MSFIPYQVDYTVQNTAKTLGFSKKRVTFKFGFANRKALSEGLTGPACRGSEHEITFVWSLKTGKRQLFLDNKDLHFSESGQNGWTTDRAWQHAFSLRDRVGGVYRVHFISQPVNREVPNSRPFDIKIGHISYFDFNPIYRLGMPGMISGENKPHHHHGTSRNHYGRDSPMSPEERQQLAQARLESLRDLREQEEKQEATTASTTKNNNNNNNNKSEQPPPMQRDEDALISFDDDPAPPPPVAAAAGPATGYHTVPPPPAVPGGVPLVTNTQNNNPQFVSALSMDTAIEENPRLQSGGTSGSGGVAGMYGSNPYARQPPAAAAAGYPAYGSSNPYAAPPPPATSSSYGAAAPAASSSTSSNALTPYNPSATSQPQQQPQPYVDATGRLSMGQQAPPTQQYQPQQPASASYGINNNNINTSYISSSTTSSLNYSASAGPPPSSSAGSLNYSSSTNYGGGFAGAAPSPSNQTQYSQMSYGSAPSFAQPPPQYTSGYPPQAPPPPPRQQQQQQQPPNYSSYNY